MSTPLKKPPRDVNQLARFIADVAAGDVLAPPDPRDPAAVKRGRAGGLKGGRSRKEALSAEERQRIAKQAAAARWKKRS